jgi:hypothetical protein
VVVRNPVESTEKSFSNPATGKADSVTSSCNYWSHIWIVEESRWCVEVWRMAYLPFLSGILEETIGTSAGKLRIDLLDRAE